MKSQTNNKKCHSNAGGGGRGVQSPKPLPWIRQGTTLKDFKTCNVSSCENQA